MRDEISRSQRLPRVSERTDVSAHAAWYAVLLDTILYTHPSLNVLSALLFIALVSGVPTSTSRYCRSTLLGAIAPHRKSCCPSPRDREHP